MTQRFRSGHTFLKKPLTLDVSPVDGCARGSRSVQKFPQESQFSVLIKTVECQRNPSVPHRKLDFMIVFLFSASWPHLNTGFILWGNRRVSAVEHKSNQWFNKNLCPLNEVGSSAPSPVLLSKWPFFWRNDAGCVYDNADTENNYTKLIERWGGKIQLGG